MASLTPAVLESFQLSKVFQSGSQRINSGAFYSDGSLFVVGSDDETISLYDTQDGIQKSVINSKKYGVDHVRFTHNPQAIIHASKNGWDETIRYLSLHDQKYIRYFRGHRDRVTSLKMSPVSDTFLSSSLDGTVRMWDLRTHKCQGLLHARTTAGVSFDPEGVIFGVALTAHTEAVKLYDLRSFDNGPFASWRLPHPQPLTLSDLTFSNDGLHILLQSLDGLTFMLDAFQGNVEHVFSGYKNDCGSCLPCAFSPDAQYASVGSEDGAIYVWKVAAPTEPPIVWRGHGDAVGVVAWNPTSIMLASASNVLAFWLPQREVVDAASRPSSSSGST